MLTEIQKSQRKIGGSDSAVILGLSKHRTALQLYLEKIGELEPQFDEVNPPDFIHFGNVLEGVIADEYARRHDVKLRRVNQVIVSEKYPWLSALPDRMIVGQNAGLECKNSYAFNKDFGSELADDVPEQYLVQVQHYLLVTEADYWSLAVLMGGNTYRDYKIMPNPRLAKQIIEATEVFAKQVETRTPPAIQTTDDARLMFPSASAGRAMELSLEYKEKMDDFVATQAQIKLLEGDAESLKAQIMAAMGEAEVATLDGVPLATWKNQSATRLDTAKLKAEVPEIYQQYSKTSESRVFRVSKGAK